MHRFWETIIQPLLETLHPQRIVEIGADQGFNTKNLLTFCDQHDVQLEAIAPLPRFDVEAWQKQYGERLRVHRMLSLNAIPRLERFEAVLIDGDHNWYTVFHELKLIENRSAELGQPFPLVFLHDIGWPYGRRDLYYNPETIPEAYRKPYRKKGIRPDTSELLEEGGGINPHFNNALSENNLQNGVLTAIEDFLRATKEPLELIKIPGFHGLGIIIPGWMLEQNSQFSQRIIKLRPTLPLARHMEMVEEERLALDLQRQEREATIRRLDATVKRTEGQLTEGVQMHENAPQGKIPEAKMLQQRLVESTQALATVQARLTAFEHRKATERKALREEFSKVDQALAIIQAQLVALEQRKATEGAALQRELTGVGKGPT